MSAVTIYVPLLDEDVEVWRPVQARPLGRDEFEILDLEPPGESWPFQRGTRVRCRMKVFSGGERGLVAFESVEPASS